MSSPVKHHPPQFMDCGGCTVRVNPPTSPTAYLCLQIMEPPIWKQDETLQAPGTFTQIYLNREQAKQLADILYAQLVLELVNEN